MRASCTPAGLDAETLTGTGTWEAFHRPPWPAGGDPAETVICGGVDCTLTVPVSIDPVAAPALPAPSVALHRIACAPLEETEIEPVRPVCVDVCPLTVMGAPLSVHESAVTPAGLVAEMGIETGSCVPLPLKKPFCPVGGVGAVTVTCGGVPRMLTVAVICEPAAAPVLPAPSVAPQTSAWVPSALSVSDPTRLLPLEPAR